MADSIRIAAAVPETRPADVKRNTGAVLSLLAEAHRAGADLAVFPALCLTGCGLGDLYATGTLLSAAEEAKRAYTIFGRASLGTGEWTTPTNSLHRFFKVEVEMK